MLSLNIKKYLGPIKKNRSKKIWWKYFLAILFPVKASLIKEEYWSILFILCFAIFYPKLILPVWIFMIYKTNFSVVSNNEIKQDPEEIEKLVLYIHMNHLQSLTEAIESNPQLLYCDYKKKSLLHWCKVYGNTKAFSVVAQMTQKYPKDQPLAA